MGRPVVLSNSRMFVGLDENGLVHDFYYPYVGEDNLTNSRSLQHKIGVWVDGQFSWIDDGSWKIKIDFEETALISSITLSSSTFQLELLLSDFVDSEDAAFIRRIKVVNQADTAREVRVFMHQVFQISHVGRGDTALYVPDDHYLLDYKGRCCLIIAGRSADGTDFDQFAVGNYGIEGKTGTFKDSEDGELSGNLVEHGGVDSVIRFSASVPANESWNFDYWIVAAPTQLEAQLVHTKLKHQGIERRIASTREHFSRWLKPAQDKLNAIAAHDRNAVLKSLLIIKAHCDNGGSILASGDSSIFNYGRDYYCYCWPRDGAYAVWPLIRLGIYDEARAFFQFASDTMHRDGYMMHKYQPDRSIGSTWHPMLHNDVKELAIQEDETASVLFMMGEYYEATHDRNFVEHFYEPFVLPAAHFMTYFVDDITGLPHASYDLWEEKFLTTTYTVSVTIASLKTAIRFSELVDRPLDSEPWRRSLERMQQQLETLRHPEGYYQKGYLLQKDGQLEADETVDISSLQGIYLFSGIDIQDESVRKTAEKVEDRLLDRSPAGGVARYEEDNYFRTKHNYPGNPWIVCTAWLAQYYAAVGRIDDAKRLLAWCMDRRLTSGVLSEQFDPEDGKPLGVTPLVWSSAELINTILDINQL